MSTSAALNCQQNRDFRKVPWAKLRSRGVRLACAAFAAAQLNKVAAEVYKDSVSNVPRWGNDIHQAEFVSELFGTTPLACFADRFTPHGGDESTVGWVTVCMPWRPWPIFHPSCIVAHRSTLATTTRTRS